MKTVLLAYERDQDLAAVETVLQARGHRVLKARSGVEALDTIRAEPLDAVVSDVQLPKLDGFALCRRLREDPDYLQVPVILHSFRVEGPKYEAFAAEVGAVKFVPRGSKLDEVLAAIDSTPGSGTMRMPALVPELLDRREQDRRRVAELEKQVRDLEAAKQSVEASERIARERAEYEARARTEFAASESTRIKDLQLKIGELEAAQKRAAEAARKQARGAADGSKTESAKLAALEARLVEVQTARARAQAAANDVERAFVSQPTPTYVVDMESRLVHFASDSGAALAGLEPAMLHGKPFAEVLPGAIFPDENAREAVIAWRRQDGSDARLELRRLATSFAGRACWIVTARDVTDELSARERAKAFVLEAQALEAAPEACGIVDPEGRFSHGNRALLALLGLDRAALASVSLQSLAVEEGGDTTIRTSMMSPHGPQRQELRWARPDGAQLDVEVSIAPCAADATTLRVVNVRDISLARRTALRNERDEVRSTRLLDLAQRAHGLTENELLELALQLAQELTGSALACVFLAGAEAPVVELTARRGDDAANEAITALNRWRGVPPQHTALYECVKSQRSVVRESAESTDTLQQAGLPTELPRQLATPMLESGHLTGVLLLAGASRPYDDDDRRHASLIAEAAWKVLRRRRSSTELVSAMDQMERVMFGSIESLAQLAEAQDACKTGRSKRVGDYAAGIGTALGLPGHAVRGLRVAGQLIDVGMLQIPRELLWRPGLLSAAEFELVKTHAERGFDALKGVEFPWPVAEVVRQHHERLDGSGYPRALTADDILLEARIVAVADAVEAMLATRPHRAALTLQACIDELQSQAGRRYDAKVVKACVRLLRDGQAHGQASVSSIHEGEAPVGQRIA